MGSGASVASSGSRSPRPSSSAWRAPSSAIFATFQPGGAALRDIARRVVEARAVDPALLWILATLLVAAGLAGVVLPGLPGVPLVLAGLVVGAWIDDFEYVGRGTLLVIGTLALFATAAEFAGSAL